MKDFFAVIFGKISLFNPCILFCQGMRGLWMWTITVFSFALFLRGEEPLRLKLRHLKLPSNYSGFVFVVFTLLSASYSLRAVLSDNFKWELLSTAYKPWLTFVRTNIYVGLLGDFKIWFCYELLQCSLKI